MPLITSIADLLLKDFIKCCVDADYTCLGEGTKDEHVIVFNSLLSEYYEVSGNESMKSECKLRCDIMLLELRQKHIATLIEILKERYSPAAIGGLKHYYPLYDFSPESYQQDINKVVSGEISRKIDYDLKKEEVKGYNEDKNSKPQTPMQQHAAFISRLMDINKIEGVRYDMATCTVLEFALGEARKTQYIKNLEAQSKRNGSR